MNESPRRLRALVVLNGRASARPASGVGMRRHHLLHAAGRVADLEVFVTNHLDDEVLDEMSSTYGARVGCARARRVVRSRLGRALQLLRHAGSPTSVARHNWRTLRRDLSSWMTSYQITVVEVIDAFLILAPVLSAPVVVDHDDRQAVLLRQIRPLLRKADERHRHRPGVAGSALSFARKAARDLYLMLDQYRWLRAERTLMRRADSILVASEEDVFSRHAHKMVVVPNGFQAHGPPVGSPHVRTPPTVAFWGALSYRPNRDGVQWFLADVLPRLVEQIPDVRVLVIGGGSELLCLPDDSRVVVTGFVEDLSLFLSQADVAVVPLRSGSGTRIKIIEAWANDIPVVSTSLGAYGLGAIDGDNLLLADDAPAFADAVALCLRDGAVRDRLIEHGAARARALSWSTIEKDFSQHLVRVAESYDR